ncbi:MAG TPA: type I-B CRISPR-associated protein Cas7/Csh2 [bacterium]|nr:type I-B CRISPR-associated protein Cas7/Csh2 [bacterium]
MNEEKIKNSDIIFIYDAKLCNPNGDPDDENKPRMDYQTSRNLVSDVRLKRYIRDYLYAQGYEVFVSKIDDMTVDATKRVEKLFENYEENGKKGGVEINKLEEKHIKWLLQRVIDVRMFGATMPIKAKKGIAKGASNAFTGPVQFNWGYSLNKVQIVESSTITSMLAGRGEEYSTMGKDWRVYYSLIAFYGIISGKRAEKTMFSEQDIKILDNALLKSIPQEATTRSKIGQKPRLLVRIEYIDNTTFLGDLRRYIKIEPDDNLRDINEFELEVNKLVNLVTNNKSKINKIYLWQDDDLKLKEGQIFKELIENGFKDKIIDLPHSEE